MKIATRILIAGLLAVVAGCTVHEVEPPPLTGPSEFGLRIALRAIPDSILQDGASQSVIEIDVSGPDGRPVRGQPLRIEIFLDGIPQDFGTLSAKTVVTGDDGRARVTYTAPPRPLEPVDEGIVITVHVTPIGSDFRGETPRTVDIRLVTPGVIRPPIPPNEIPVAMFTFAPTAPVVGQTVTFDASTSTDVINGAPVPCGSRCTYAWSFGDGDTATGIFATHVYRRADTYQVRLTVTDAQGATGQAAQTVPVTLVPAAPPTASFVFSPQNPAVSQPVTFNASASRATLGRSIVSYAWDFGDGGRGQGVIVTKTYTVAATYTVTLTVTDDRGEQATVSNSVVVGGTGTGPTATLTVSPTGGSPATNFFFDGRASRGPDPIVRYRFVFGDGQEEINTTGTATHRYAVAGTYRARLDVQDSAGRIGTATIDITVTGTGGPVANLTVSPTAGTVATTYSFDGRSSTGPDPIVNYRFTFGDATPDVETSSGTTTHRYAAPGTYTARLTVFDSQGRQTTSAPVTITVQ